MTVYSLYPFVIYLDTYFSFIFRLYFFYTKKIFYINNKWIFHISYFHALVLFKSLIENEGSRGRHTDQRGQHPIPASPGEEEAYERPLHDRPELANPIDEACHSGTLALPRLLTQPHADAPSQHGV